MEIKELAKQIINFIVPILESKAVKEIKEDLSNAFNNEIRLLWSKVRNLFIEDIDDPELISKLENNPTDENIQSELKGCLSQILKNDPNLAKELKDLFSKSEQFMPETENLIKKIKGEQNLIVQGQAEKGKLKNIIEEVDGNKNQIYQGVKNIDKNVDNNKRK
jgi:hypothetical protein